MKAPDTNTKLQEAMERLYQRRTFGIKLGLHVEEAMVARLGHPEFSYGIVHVAGTNGKGSVCALLESILHAAGYRVGLYTSPHLVRFNERIRMGTRDIPDRDLAELVALNEEVSGFVSGQTGQEPTFFECSTAMALEYFRRQSAQFAVLETGMGGRLDATNVVTPLVSVITRIDLEHTRYLGPDVPSIAGEKAGIIKPGRPVVCGPMDAEAEAVVRRVAAERGARFVVVRDTASVSLVARDLSGQKVKAETTARSYGALRLPLLGDHQLENLATVLAVVDVLCDEAGAELADSEVKRGVRQVRWPGRFHVLEQAPPLILDGAHNPGAARVLARTLKQLLSDRPLGMVIGMCEDKDLNGFLRTFGGMVRRAWAVTIREPRSLPAASVAAAGRALGWDVEASAMPQALEAAREWASKNGGAVCVTGSLFLVGEVLSMASGADFDGG